jgi:hypothetical protein
MQQPNNTVATATGALTRQLKCNSRHTKGWMRVKGEGDIFDRMFGQVLFASIDESIQRKHRNAELTKRISCDVLSTNLNLLNVQSASATYKNAA